MSSTACADTNTNPLNNNDVSVTHHVGCECCWLVYVNAIALFVYNVFSFPAVCT